MKPYSMLLRFGQIVPMSLKRKIRETNLYSKFTRALKQEVVPTLSDIEGIIQSIRTVPSQAHLRNRVLQLADNRNFFLMCLVEINDVCNLNCPMCRTSLSTRKKGLMDLDLFEDSVKKIRSVGAVICGLATVGDPLANKLLADYLEILRKHGMSTDGLCTNGLLLETKLDTLFEYRDVIGRITFSIDGASRDVYESIRQGGKWDALHRGLLKFSRRNDSSHRPFPVAVTTAVSKINFHEIALIPLVFSYLAPPIDFSFVFLNSRPYPNASADHHDAYFMSQSYFDEPHMLNLPCWNMWTRVSVHKEGGLTPCCTDYDGQAECGNIATADLSHWLDNPVLDKWRRASLRGDFDQLPIVCQRCFSPDPRFTELLNMIMRYALVSLSLHPVRVQCVLDTIGPMMNARDFEGIVEVVRSLG